MTYIFLNPELLTLSAGPGNYQVEKITVKKEKKAIYTVKL